MKILITGSSGFLGKHLVLFLQNKGVGVVSYDLANGEDLLDKAKLKKKMKGADAVMHLAAYGDVYMAAQDPAGAAIAGVAGTANVVQVANECGVAKIIYASTWEVYGEPHHQPLDEEHPCSPDHPYSISKYGGELMIQSKLNQVPWVILRLGSAYGLGMRAHAVIPLFIRKAMNREQIILQGGGTQTRQFTHTEDINKAFYKALLSPVHNDIFNIVTNEVVTIKKIAQLVTDYFPTQVKLGERRAGDVPSAIVSPKKAERKLKWKASVSFQEGLQSIVKDLASPAQR